MLKAILVVLHFRDLLQAFYYGLLYFRHAALLVRLNAVEQLLYVVHLLVELLLQRGAFLLAESHEVVYGLLYRSFHHFPFLVAQFFDIGPGEHVGHAGQRAEPVGWLRYAHLFRNGFQLLVVVLHEGRVDRRGIYHGVFLRPESEVDLAA